MGKLFVGAGILAANLPPVGSILATFTIFAIPVSRVMAAPRDGATQLRPRASGPMLEAGRRGG